MGALIRWLRMGQASPWPLVAIGLLVIGIGLAVDLRRQYQEAQMREQARLNSAAALVARIAAERLASAVQVLERLDDALRANPLDAQAIVQTLSALERNVIALLVIDADGRVLASNRPEHLNANLAENELVWAARAV